MERCIAATQSGKTYVYSWDFMDKKWTNFANDNRYSKFQIFKKKGEFYMRVIPEDRKPQETFDFYLPRDVQVSKTKDMLQFPVPDRQDATGGKLIAVRFRDSNDEEDLINKVRAEIDGFANSLLTGAMDTMLGGQDIPNDGRQKTNYNPPTLAPEQPGSETSRWADPVRNDGDKYQHHRSGDQARRSGEQSYNRPNPPMNDHGNIPPAGHMRDHAYREESQYHRRADYNPPLRDDNRRNDLGREDQRSEYRRDDPRNDFRTPAAGGAYQQEEPHRRDVDPRDRAGGYGHPYQKDPDHPHHRAPTVPGGYRHEGPPHQRDSHVDPRDRAGAGGFRQEEPSYRNDPDPRDRAPTGAGGRQQEEPFYRIDSDPRDRAPTGAGGYRQEEPFNRRDSDPRDRAPTGAGGHRQEEHRRDSDPRDRAPWDNYDRRNDGYPRDQYPGHQNPYKDPSRGYPAQNQYVQDPTRDPPRNVYGNDPPPRPPKPREPDRYNNAPPYNRGPLGPTPKKLAPINVKPPGSVPDLEVPSSMSGDTINLDVRNYVKSLEDSLNTGNVENAKRLVALLAEKAASGSDMLQSMGSYTVDWKLPDPDTVNAKQFSLTCIVEDFNGKTYPIYLDVMPFQTVEYLKSVCHKKFKIHQECQYWVIGNELADDSKKLSELKVDQHITVFIYVKHPHKAKVSPNEIRDQQKKDQIYYAKQEQQQDRGDPPGQRDQPSQQRNQHSQQYQYDHQDQRGQQYQYDHQDQRGHQYKHLPQDSYNRHSGNDGAVFRGDNQGPRAIGPPLGGVQVMPNEHPSEEYDGFAKYHPPIQHPRQEEPPPPKEPEEVGWKCPVCTCLNLPMRPGCEACTAARPSDYKPPPGYVMGDDELKYAEVSSQDEIRKYQENERELARQRYQNLLQADEAEVVAPGEEFNCPVCFTDIDPGDGVMLRECLHQICRNCLHDSIMYSEDAEIKCPFQADNYTCVETISAREMRAVLSEEELDRVHQRGLRQAEAAADNSFHCRSANCKGFCFYEDEVNEFHCDICGHNNCILCKAQHEGQNCKQYQDDLRIKAENDEAAKKTQEMLDNMLTEGEAMKCPKCQVIVQKKVGCDWIKCSMCKTEMCWATKGPRWGPGGPGDTSGGCRCGVNRKRCHPNCRNCH